MAYVDKYIYYISTCFNLANKYVPIFSGDRIRGMLLRPNFGQGVNESNIIPKAHHIPALHANP